MRAPGESLPEPSKVASLDEARAAAADAQIAGKAADSAHDEDEQEVVEVVPVKKS